MTAPSNSPLRLYPPFRHKLLDAIDQANKETAGKFQQYGFRNWGLFEGFRSPDRQQWLYEQGRTRRGRVVTWLQAAAGMHPKGLAGDVIWYDDRGRPRWDGPAALWQRLGHAARAHGLRWGGDWRQRDLPHIEAPRTMIPGAALWIRRQPWARKTPNT